MVYHPTFTCMNCKKKFQKPDIYLSERNKDAFCCLKCYNIYESQFIKKCVACHKKFEDKDIKIKHHTIYFGQEWFVLVHVSCHDDIKKGKYPELLAPEGEGSAYYKYKKKSKTTESTEIAKIDKKTEYPIN